MQKYILLNASLFQETAVSLDYAGFAYWPIRSRKTLLATILLQSLDGGPRVGNNMLIKV